MKQVENGLLLNENEPEYDKNNKMTCVPSNDTSQPWHAPCLINVRCPLEVGLGPKLPIKHTLKTLIRLADVQAYLSLCWPHIVILLVLSCSGSNHFENYFLRHNSQI